MKTVLITGAARGLGREIAEAFAPDHATAFTWHHHPPDAACAAMPEALAVQADLLAPGAASAVIRRVLDRFGRLDILVDNAGPVIPTARALGRRRASLDRMNLGEGSTIIHRCSAPLYKRPLRMKAKARPSAKITRSIKLSMP